MPDLVIGPTLDMSIPHLHPNFHRVGPIVRQDYAASKRNQNIEADRAVIRLCGSTFGSKIVFKKTAYPFAIDVIGRDAPEGVAVPEKVTFHGCIKDTRSLLSDAKLMIVNGGFSAVSEAFCLLKPMIVVLVPNHAEQWINGRTIVSLKVGCMAGEQDLEEAMFAALKSSETYYSRYDELGKIPDGADQAAEILVDTMNGKLC